MDWDDAAEPMLKILSQMDGTTNSEPRNYLHARQVGELLLIIGPAVRIVLTREQRIGSRHQYRERGPRTRGSEETLNSFT